MALDQPVNDLYIHAKHGGLPNLAIGVTKPFHEESPAFGLGYENLILLNITVLWGGTRPHFDRVVGYHDYVRCLLYCSGALLAADALLTGSAYDAYKAAARYVLLSTQSP